MFKFAVIGGIFLTWFADAVLFGIMVQTEFADEVETTQDLVDMDMSLGKYSFELKLGSKLIFLSSLGSYGKTSGWDVRIRKRNPQNTR